MAILQLLSYELFCFLANTDHRSPDPHELARYVVPEIKNQSMLSKFASQLTSVWYKQFLGFQAISIPTPVNGEEFLTFENAFSAPFTNFLEDLLSQAPPNWEENIFRVHVCNCGTQFSIFSLMKNNAKLTLSKE